MCGDIKAVENAECDDQSTLQRGRMGSRVLQGRWVWLSASRVGGFKVGGRGTQGRCRWVCILHGKDNGENLFIYLCSFVVDILF